jgi:hypothetical protein
VNGRSRPVIMADMESRIMRADLVQEKQDAIQVSSLVSLSLIDCTETDSPSLAGYVRHRTRSREKSGDSITAP